MEEYVLTEEHKKLLEEMDDLWKHELGSRDIEHCINNESEKFDRRKFGKMKCGCCGHSFNPYYTKTIKEDKWEWQWVGMDYKQPEAKCEVNCPKCKEKLRFTIYIGQ